MHNDISNILVSEQEIGIICETLGKQINHDYKDKNPIFIGLLKGCILYVRLIKKLI